MESAQKRLNESAPLRWTVLVLISGLLFATYWFQDCLGPLKSLMESQLGFDSSQFGMLVASTTWANLALMIIKEMTFYRGFFWNVSFHGTLSMQAICFLFLTGHIPGWPDRITILETDTLIN